MQLLDFYMKEKNYLFMPLFNPEYWDCKCVENYIHKRPRNYCPKCGAIAINCTDSWVHEVKIMYDRLKDLAIYLTSLSGS
jgi:hypothetical protein